VRDFQHNLYRSPLEANYRVAIIEKAETTPSTSFDILLKTIEEPPPDSLILILTDNPDRLPDTIRSRCQKIRFKRVFKDFIADYLIKEKNLNNKTAEFIASLSFGSISRAENLCESDFFEERESAITLLGYLLTHPIDSFWTEFSSLVNLRDKARVENLMTLWQILYHDISIICSDADNVYLINKDQTKIIKKLADQVGSFENAQNGLDNLLALQRLFYRNVNPSTALFDLADRLKNHRKPLEIRD